MNLPSQSMPDDTINFPPAGYVPAESLIRGIEVYQPEKVTQQLPDVLDFKCPRCGATTSFDTTTTMLTCDHCGYTEMPTAKLMGRSAEGFEFQVETVRRSERGWGEERKDMACQRCGGVVSVPREALAFSCPFCGSNKVIYRETLEDVLRPRYMIPFQVDTNACEAAMRSWLGSSWVTPAELRDAAKPEKYNPLYTPYWTFTAGCAAVWKAQVAHVTTEYYLENGVQKTRERVTWRDESGKVQNRFQNLLVPATTRLNMAALGRIDAYDLNALVLYEPRYLAGMRAQAYDLPLEEAWATGRQIIRERMRRSCLDRASSTRVRNFTMTVDFGDEEWRYILVPVYTSVYHYGDKTYQVLINGQTGTISGPRPVDWEKIWLVIAGLLSPGLLLAFVGWLFRSAPSGELTSGIGLLLMVIGLVIAFFIVQHARGIENV